MEAVGCALHEFVLALCRAGAEEGASWALVSSPAKPVHVDRHKTHWQQRIMGMAVSLAGGWGEQLPVCLDVSRSRRHWWVFCRDDRHFEAPVFGDVVFVLLHGLFFCLSPLKVE